MTKKKQKYQQPIRYEFECRACQHVFELYLTMDEKRPKTCPECKTGEVFQHFASTVISYVGEAKTAGQQAERNAKRLGNEMIREMENQDPVAKARRKQKEAKLPWFRDGSIEGTIREEKAIDTTKIKDLNKYIETGEKN